MTELDDFITYLEKLDLEICYHSPFDGLVPMPKNKLKEQFQKTNKIEGKQ